MTVFDESLRWAVFGDRVCQTVIDDLCFSEKEPFAVSFEKNQSLTPKPS